MPNDLKDFLSHSSVEKRKDLLRQSKYIIDQIFPANALHIVSGASGSGKSTWLYQMLADWTLGNDLFGYRSFPCKWVMITYDRGTRDNAQTLRRIGLHEWDFPLFSFEDLYSFHGSEPDLFTLLRDHRFRDVELFVIEGIMSFIPDPKPKQSQNKCEQMWITKVRSELLKDRTIIGTAHQTKQNIGNMTSRMSMIGSASFIGGVGTVVLFDDPPETKQAQKNGKVPIDDGTKIVTICPRNAKDIRIQYSRDEKGRFVPFEDDIAELTGNANDKVPMVSSNGQIHFVTGSKAPEALKHMLIYLDGIPIGDILMRQTMEVEAMKVAWSRATFDRFISEMIEKGILVRITKGTFRKSVGKAN